MNREALLPERHKNRDFFAVNFFGDMSWKDDMASMEFPFFSLSTKPDTRDLHYTNSNGTASLSIKPTIDGLPTIFDKDVLLYCMSVLVSETNKGNPAPRTIRFTAYDLLVSTNRTTSVLGYDRLKAALERLAGVSITTNIKTNDVEAAAGFGLIDSWQIIKRSPTNNRMVKLEVTLSNWFYNSVLGNEVLTINRDYFRLRKPLERRIYELARKHCGEQDNWIISLENLQKKTGSGSPIKKFRFYIRKMIETNHLPDYMLSLDAQDVVTFAPKDQQQKDSQKRKKRKKSLAKSKPASPIRFRDYLNENTLDIGQRLTHEARSGWDYMHLIIEWEIFTYGKYQKTGEYPKNLDGAFIAFIKKKVKILA